MAITAAEAKSWYAVFEEVAPKTTPPYYGVNTFDVRKENWDAMVNNAKEQMESVEAVGGRLHLWAVTDLGSIKRVVWINYYPVSIWEAGPSMLSQEQQQRMMELTDESMTLYDKYHWFLAAELPDGPTTIA